VEPAGKILVFLNEDLDRCKSAYILQNGLRFLVSMAQRTQPAPRRKKNDCAILGRSGEFDGSWKMLENSWNSDNLYFLRYRFDTNTISDLDYEFRCMGPTIFTAQGGDQGVLAQFDYGSFASEKSRKSPVPELASSENHLISAPITWPLETEPNRTWLSLSMPTGQGAFSPARVASLVIELQMEAGDTITHEFEIEFETDADTEPVPASILERRRFCQSYTPQQNGLARVEIPLSVFRLIFFDQKFRRIRILPSRQKARMMGFRISFLGD